MQKLTAALLTLFLLLTVSACGRAEYGFILLEGETASEASYPKGGEVPGKALVYTEAGDVFYAENYRVTEPLYGIILDPPKITVAETYELAKAVLESGERVMVVYIDGLSWGRYSEALENGELDSLAALSGQRAASFYPTITPVNYAGMTTGRPPMENGVTKRGDHALSCGSIFDLCEGKAFISEGDTQIINFSVSQELNPDLNGNGDTDDEVFEAAMEAVGEDYKIVFVHFHGLDDTSHASGPFSAEAKQKLVDIDEMCAELFAAWEGRIIVASDHGQHENDGNGDKAYADKEGIHGAFAASDIFIPILTN